MLNQGETTLRAYRDSDLGCLSSLRNDTNLQALLLALPRPSSEERVRTWASTLANQSDALFFVISDRSSDDAVGFIQLTEMHPLHGIGTLGMAIHPTAQGKGHGRSALSLLESFARSVFGVRKISLRVLSSNGKAVRLYERSGYVHIGKQRAHHFHAGEYHDVDLMEKLLGREVRS